MDGIGLSPAQLLMSRRLNTKLPVKNSLLKAKTHNGIHSQLESRQSNYKMHYDKNAHHQYPPLKQGDSVYVTLNPYHKHKQWQQAQVKSVLGNKSYEVQTDHGTYRRNARHIIMQIIQGHNIRNKGYMNITRTQDELPLLSDDFFRFGDILPLSQCFSRADMFHRVRMLTLIPYQAVPKEFLHHNLIIETLHTIKGYATSGLLHCFQVSFPIGDISSPVSLESRMVHIRF